MKVAGARTSRTTRGVANTNRNIINDSPKLNLEVFFFFLESRRSVLHNRIRRRKWRFRLVDQLKVAATVFGFSGGHLCETLTYFFSSKPFFCSLSKSESKKRAERERERDKDDEERKRRRVQKWPTDDLGEKIRGGKILGTKIGQTRINLN